MESTFEKVRDRLCTLLDSNPIFEEFCEMLSMLLLFFDTYKMENENDKTKVVNSLQLHSRIFLILFYKYFSLYTNIWKFMSELISFVMCYFGYLERELL